MNKERRLSIKKRNTLKRKRNTLKRKKNTLKRKRNTLKRKRNTLKRKNSERNLKRKNIKGGRPVRLRSQHFHCPDTDFTPFHATSSPTVTMIIGGNGDKKTEYVIDFTSHKALLIETLTTYKDRFISDFPPGEAFNEYSDKQGLLDYIKKKMNVPETPAGETPAGEDFENTFRGFFDDLIARIANISNIKISFSECEDLYKSLKNIQKYVKKSLIEIYTNNYIVKEIINHNKDVEIRDLPVRVIKNLYSDNYRKFKDNIDTKIKEFMKKYEEQLEHLSLSLNKDEDCKIRVGEINNLFEWMFKVPYNEEFIISCFYKRERENPRVYEILPKSLISEFIKIVQWILSRDNESI